MDAIKELMIEHCITEREASERVAAYIDDAYDRMRDDEAIAAYEAAQETK